MESAGKYRYEFELAGLPTMPNAMSNGPNAWRARWREGQQWKKDVWAMCVGHLPKSPLAMAKVTFLRSAHGVAPDSDGLAHSFKPVRDGLVQAKVLMDDSPEHIEAIYLWEKGKYRKGWIRVTIEEL
jgi:hypothetical protein